MPRVRDRRAGTGVPLQTYARLQQSRAADEGLLRRVLYGFSCRDYAAAKAAARAWRSLTTREQAAAVLMGGNYGEAGALAMYRQRLALPYPISVHCDFHAWGPGQTTGQLAVIVSGPHARSTLEELFLQVEEVERVENPWAVTEEQDVRIYVARGPRRPLAQLWPTLGPRWD